jgi:formyl-CoA transferase
MPADSTPDIRPLADVKVIDIANFLAGPISSMFLADFGADVVKVERPGTGDEIRYWGNNKDGVGLMYKLINRNKRSVTADLRTPVGVEIVKRLVKDADIIVENYRKGTLEKWGLGYDVLSAINPSAGCVARTAPVGKGTDRRVRDLRTAFHTARPTGRGL